MAGNFVICAWHFCKQPIVLNGWFGGGKKCEHEMKFECSMLKVSCLKKKKKKGKKSWKRTNHSDQRMRHEKKN